MKTLIFSLFFLSLSVIPSALTGQQINTVSEAKFMTLQYVNTLPKNILASKSVVFVKVSLPAESGAHRGDWESFAREAHEYFKKTHIDPVAYYYFDDVFSSNESIKAFSEQLAKRQIANIIFWKKDYGEKGYHHTLVITPFNQKETFIEVGQKAWKTESAEAEKCLGSLYLLANQSNLAVKNLMIGDEPEFFSSVKVISAKRYESFPPDLKIEKLAVPKFPLAEIPAGATEETKSLLSTYNEQVEVRNKRLKTIFETFYPYQFALVDPGLTAKEIKNQGYQFMLGSIGATGAVLKKNLDYEFDEQETDYISVAWNGEKNSLMKLSAETPVIKYYVKQTFSKSIYLGTKWDTAIVWEQSLQNYLNNLKKELVN